TLGWGGFWSWDPVENAGLLPWFTATAFLHSVMVQERRGMLRVWNVTLVIVTFFLTIFGTFMTRSGVVQSVHAFGEDRWLASLFTAFMVLIVTFSFALVIYRLPLLRSRHELDSWASREAAFLANNWILLFSAFFILFATMFPTLSEAVRGQRLTVGPPFFNMWMRPIGLTLLVLTGIAPLLAWRKSTLSNLLHDFTWPVVALIATAAAVYALGITVWSSGLCFALCAFVGVTILQEFVRGAKVRRDSTGTDQFTALIGLVARQRRRYGGYIVHFGIVLMFLGFAGQGYKREEQVRLNTGQQTTVGKYTIRHDSIGVTSDDQKQMVTARVSVSENGKPIGQLEPARWFYAHHEDEPRTMVAMRRTMGEDLYVVLAAYEAQSQSATYAITINPLVNWIWFGFGVLAFGTIIALLPERTFAFAAAKAPAEAVTTGLMLLILLLPAVPARAQHVESAQNIAVVPKTSLERELQHEIICMCRTCGRQRLADCQCGIAAQMREELARLVARGMTREQVYQYYIDKYGSQEPLASPINRGFNRVAWALPYIAGASGAVLVGFVAVRWTRRDHNGRTAEDSPEAAPAGTEDPALRERLDDELRDLD
ncbi:MAG TPA: cytochrome c-type biogenesis CcmF C-terminal domain-containing protein, partial [Vicinamibacterales bacterium]